MKYPKASVKAQLLYPQGGAVPSLRVPGLSIHHSNPPSLYLSLLGHIPCWPQEDLFCPAMWPKPCSVT